MRGCELPGVEETTNAEGEVLLELPAGPVEFLLGEERREVEFTTGEGPLVVRFQELVSRPTSSPPSKRVQADAVGAEQLVQFLGQAFIDCDAVVTSARTRRVWPSRPVTWKNRAGRPCGSG